MKHSSLARGVSVLVLLFAAGQVLADGTSQWRQRICTNHVVEAVPLVETTAQGHARLCERATDLKAKMTIKGLTPGHAYTTWWVYIDDPSQCAGTTPLPLPFTTGKSPCDFDDFAGEKPLVVFGRMASGVSPRRGLLHLSGEFGGMQPSSGSEVWLFTFGHGPANLSDGDALARQLLTPEDPSAGAPHLGNFVDGLLGYPAAVAVFKIQ